VPGLKPTARAAACALAVLLSGAAGAWAQDPPPEPPPGPDETPRQAPTEVPNPRRLKFVAPDYPPEAVMQGLRGIVILELVVDTKGKVASVEVVRSVPPFDEPALKAVRQWEYEVTRVDGKPVPVRLTLPITFAVKMPEIARDPGIPELIRGVGPPFPAGVGAQSASVKADVTVDGDGNVVEARVISGESPWAEAMIQAVRTWRFAAPGGDGHLALEAQAEFQGAGKDGAKVVLQLRRPRRVATASPTASPAPEATPAAPAEPAPASPAPSPGASPAAPPPSVQAVTGSASPAPSPAPGAPTAAPPAAAPGLPAPPPVEVLPAPGAPAQVAPAPARPTEGVSAVRDVTLAVGIPDLASGRRPMVPPLARMSGTSGQVVVRFAVDTAGITGSLQVDGPELLKEAARQTVASWTFRRERAERIYLRAVLTYEGDTARARVERAE
jgi:TonB family protein